MKKTNEIKRMQQLASVTNEGIDPLFSLTDQEKTYLKNRTEAFINTAVLNSDIVANDFEYMSPAKEKAAIQFIVDILKAKIS